MKTLKERITTIIVMTFLVFSLWVNMTPTNAMAASSNDIKFPKTVTNDNSIGKISWKGSSLSGAYNDDDAFATTYIDGDANTASNYLKARNYCFNIPDGATINGIKVEINRKASNDNRLKDYMVKLVKSNIIVGDSRAKANSWYAAELNVLYGGENDTWGNTWTPEEINSTDFGVALSVLNTNSNNTTASVDYMKITVYYTPDTTAPTLSAVNIASNNDNKLMAKEGDKVTLSFTATEAIKTPEVTIAGHAVDPINTSDNAWKAEYTMAPNDTEGAVAFNIAFSDSAGIAGIPVTTTTDSSSVVYDTAKPVITLNGAATVTVGVGTSYTDAGAAATDSHDGTITDKIINGGTVDTSKAGSYTLTYDVTDTSGNNALQVTRIVNVEMLPTISLNTNVIKVNVNETYGKMYFLSTATVTEGFKLVECGVVMSLDISSGIDINNKRAILSAPKQSSAGQFYSVFNVTYDRTIYVRSYIVYEDANGVLSTGYSNIITAKMIKQ